VKLQQLNEATLKIDRLVDFFYDEVFTNFIKEIDKFKQGRNANFYVKDQKFTMRDIPQRFITDEIRMAYETIPVVFYVGVYLRGSFYSPQKHKVQMSFNSGVMDILDNAKRNGLSYEQMLGAIPKTQQPNFKSELSGVKVRGSIAHEVSHWMRDAIHGKQLSKMLTRADKDPRNRAKILHKGMGDDYLTDYEIDAIIHDIVDVRRRYSKDEWDDLTIEDLLDITPTVNITRAKLRGKQRELFMKLILKRMNRERLIGRNMKGLRH